MNELAPLKGQLPVPESSTTYESLRKSEERFRQVVEAAPNVPPSSARATQAASPSNAAITAHRPASVNAAVINRWLTPSTLQKQFILTEIFQPPLALRGDR